MFKYLCKYKKSHMKYIYIYIYTIYSNNILSEYTRPLVSEMSSMIRWKKICDYA